MLSSVVVTNPRVPRIIRHSLNLESGLNDGLALPAVLAFTAAAAGDETTSSGGGSCSRTCCVGVASGLVVAFVASRLMPRDTALGHPISPHQKSLYARRRGLRGVRHGGAPAGGQRASSRRSSAAIALGIWRPDIRECFEERSEDLIEVVKLGVFLVFGATLTFGRLFADGWAAVGIVAFTLLVARPIAVFTALAGTRQVDTAEKAFMAWFGPKGVATMTFALLVLGSDAPERRADREHRRAGRAHVRHRARRDGPARLGVDRAARRAGAAGGYLTRSSLPVFALMRNTASFEKVPGRFPGRDSETIQ